MTIAPSFRYTDSLLENQYVSAMDIGFQTVL